MYWYSIKKIKEGYIVIKTVETERSLGSGQKFFGTKSECMKYCKDRNIDLRKKYKLGE